MYNLPSFDQLKKLNDLDPKAFEALREQLVNDCIETAPAERQHRLQGLQFHINSRRELANSPMESCISLSRMMHETFSDMHNSLEGLAQLTAKPNTERNITTTEFVFDSKKTADILTLSSTI
ncbi:MAG: hypothetical protein OFPII_04700 [Osedax symbiont Rs1]|nr:MAG: hypothetical protein OFPII_04700 [Osedax symbiont Rs1]